MVILLFVYALAVRESDGMISIDFAKLNTQMVYISIIHVCSVQFQDNAAMHVVTLTFETEGVVC